MKMIATLLTFLLGFPLLYGVDSAPANGVRKRVCIRRVEGVEWIRSNSSCQPQLVLPEDSCVHNICMNALEYRPGRKKQLWEQHISKYIC